MLSKWPGWRKALDYMKKEESVPNLYVYSMSQVEVLYVQVWNILDEPSEGGMRREPMVPSDGVSDQLGIYVYVDVKSERIACRTDFVVLSVAEANAMRCNVRPLRYVCLSLSVVE